MNNVAIIEKTNSGYKVTTPTGSIWDFMTVEDATKFCQQRSFDYVCKW